MSISGQDPAVCIPLRTSAGHVRQTGSSPVCPSERVEGERFGCSSILPRMKWFNGGAKYHDHADLVLLG